MQLTNLLEYIQGTLRVTRSSNTCFCVSRWVIQSRSLLLQNTGAIPQRAAVCQPFAPWFMAASHANCENTPRRSMAHWLAYTHALRLSGTIIMYQRRQVACLLHCYAIISTRMLGELPNRSESTEKRDLFLELKPLKASRTQEKGLIVQNRVFKLIEWNNMGKLG